MCEWLSCREWCDVRLLCGGRTFSAHRTVLASVSAFLRRILLSCPTEESPTFIVLPDFDIEAMSSVLYYIYNGEVVVQKDKLEMFLDIIKAMQIFIDESYLPKTYDIGHQSEPYPRTSKKEVVSKNIVFSLESEKCADQQYVNVKKGDQIRNILLQYSFGVLDNQQVRCQDWSEHQASLGNLQVPYEDRQRSSFLRDLFIETYPRNGNANGGSAGVLAISNERYRAPTSVLLPNANGKHLSNTLLEASDTRIDGPVWSNNFHDMNYGHDNPLNFQEFNTNSNINQYHLNGSKQLDPKLLFGYYNTLISKSKSPLLNSVPFLDELSEKHMPSLDLSEETFSRSLRASETRYKYLSTEHKKSLRNIHKIDDTLGNGGLVKGTILNQVLESPWCPRFPQNFIPFRRKREQSPKLCLSDGKKSEADVSASKNDKNNNIPSVTNVEESTVTFSPFEDKESSKISYSVACLVAGDLKCTICSQVFTSADSLNIHTRRHSSTPRYTCGECSKSFSQLRNFKYHMSIHRGTREFAATCTVCGKYFNDRGYLSSHMKIHRNRKEYKCSQCPKSFNQRVAYNMHVRIHTGVKPHVCGECGKAFSRKMLLKQHQRTHSGERPYACPHCDKRFADRSNMTLHLRLHTGVKPFSCTLCPKSFTKKHHLKSHLNFHTGAKPYSCPRCKLAFTQSSNMRTHYKKCSALDHAEGESKLANS